VIGWEEFFLVLPLMLPEVVVTAAAVGLLIGRRHEIPRGALPWLVVPTAFLGLSAVTRMTPIFFEPVQDLIESLFGPTGDNALLVVWWADLLLRLPAWGALLYGLFWKLPRREAGTPLDPKTRQAAATAALLAVLLAEAKGGADG
jgi:hypothetical protein